MRNAVVVILFCLFWPLGTNAQDFILESKHYFEEDGLLHREINTICIDQQGFIWLGCPKGLMRFDGNTFKSYPNEELRGISNGVWRMKEDAEGYLWLVSYSKEVVLMHPGKKEFIPLEEKLGRKLTLDKDDLIWDLISDEAGSIVFSNFSEDNKGELFFYHPSSGFTSVDVSHHGRLIPKYITDKKTIWCYLTQTFELIELSLTGEVLQRIKYSKDLEWVGVSVDKNELFWSFENDGALQWINNSEVNHEIFPSLSEQPAFYRNYFSTAYYIESENLLMVNEQFFDVEKQRFIDLPKDFLRSDPSVRSVIGDSNGRMWIGGNFGLTKLEIRKNYFKNYLQLKEAYNEIHFPIRGIYEKDGWLFANSEIYGLFFQDLNSIDQPSKLLFVNGWGNFALDYGKDGLLRFGNRKEIIEFNPQYSGETGELKRVGHHMLGKEIWAIFHDSSDNLWVGTESGLYKKNQADSEFTKVTGGQKYKSFDQSHIVFINSDKNGNIWICSNTGFYKYEPGIGITGLFGTNGEGDSYLPSKKFYHFLEDEDGIFWLGTAGNGLIKWDLENNLYERFTLKDGFPNNVIYAVYADNRDRLWMSSDYGIIVFDKKSHRVSSFQKKDGISHHEFNRVSHFQNEKGHLFFGSLNGLTVFDPNSLQMRDSTVSFPLSIISFQQFDGAENKLMDRTQELKETKNILLWPNDRYFHLEFALLNFNDAQKNKYAWKIEGVDKDWHYQSEHSIRLSRLPYGNHRLLLKGQASDGRWSTDELAFNVKVVRPFYMRIWFIGLACLLFVIVGPIMYYLRISILKNRQIELEFIVNERTAQINADKLTIKKQAEELQQLDEAKSRFFANVSHELRTPLTLILGPLGTLLKRNQLEDKDHSLVRMMKQNANHLLSLINEILDLSKLESGKLKLNQTPVAIYQLMQRLLAGYESHAQTQGINLLFRFKADKYLQLMLDIKKFEKIFNNLVSNALKYTPKGEKVEVILEDKGGTIELSIIDSGQGIHPDDLPNIFDRFYQSSQRDAPIEGGTGIGLALCSEYARLFEGRLSVESQLNKGSSFRFQFPKTEVMGGLYEDQIFEKEGVITMMPNQSKQPQSEKRKVRKSGKSNTILVVEDNPGLRNFLKIILSEHYHVLTAVNGEEALDCIGHTLKNGGRIDILISDVMMPVMDGMQLLEVIKSKDDLRHIPVVMLTAKAEIAAKLRALRIGVDDYMTKPFEEEELLARIDNLLTNYHERERSALRKMVHVGRETEANTKESKNDELLVSKSDLKWLEELETFVKENVNNFHFNSDSISGAMAISRSKLFRKIKNLTGLTSNQYINTVRFQLARTYLEGHVHDSVKATAFAVGFKDVEYFSRQFKKQFGRLPSSYL